MNKKNTYIFPLIVIGVLFGIFGLLTWINSILIPYFQIGLELTNFEAFLVTFASYSAYFIMAIPSAFVLNKTGYKRGISLGLVVMAVGTILFLPAAYSRAYILFLIGLFITGTGMALLQTAVNPYIVLLGPQESAAQRIGFMGLSNKVSGILGQRILGTVFLLDATVIINQIRDVSNAEKESILDNYILKVVDPYLIITGGLILLAIGVFFISLPEVDEGKSAHEVVDESSSKIRLKDLFKFPYLILGIIALFFEGACEVIPIDGVIVYSRSLGIPLDTARHFAEYTLYCMTLGYLASILLIPRYLSQQKALSLCAITGVILTVAVFLTNGITSAVLMILMGFISAWFWGTIWGLAIHNLGKYTKFGSALMLMAILGGGFFPLIFGSLIDTFSFRPQISVLMLIPCYLYLLYYAVRGHKVNKWGELLRR